MPPTREQLKQVTQQRVVDAADRLFRERGYSETTIRDIAEASGVSAGTVMATGDKNALLVRTFDRLISLEHVRRVTHLPAPSANRTADTNSNFTNNTTNSSTTHDTGGTGYTGNNGYTGDIDYTGDNGYTGNTDTCTDRLLTLVQPFVVVFTAHDDLARAYASILASGNHTSTLFTELAEQLIGEFQLAITRYECVSTINALSKAQALYFAYVGILFSASSQDPAELTSLEARMRDTFTAICTCKE